MDHTRVIIYIIGALMLLFFMWAGFRKSHRKTEKNHCDQEPIVQDFQEKAASASGPIARENDVKQMQTVSDISVGTTFEEAALNSSAQTKETVPAKSIKKSWSRIVHSTFRAHTEQTEKTQLKGESLYNRNLLVMNIFAESGQVFLGKDLVTVLKSQGFLYSSPGLFYQSDAPGVVNFRISSAVGNGLLPFEHLENFQTTGLSCFMELKHVAHPRQAFRKMLTSVHELSYALGGILQDETAQPLLQKSVARYLEKIRAVEEMSEPSVQ